ncbi:MAG: response regulator [Acidobacteriota bacterium]
MSDRVLFVDDEPAVLDGYRRLLGREISLTTAVGGEQGLAAMAESGPYGVVVSDMRMPGMDGARFLAAVRETAADTVRIALTGYADIDTAMHAVNEGHIFRFMTKPCSRENLLSAVQAGLRQHQLLVAEKELLQGTLKGCVMVLAEMLSFSNPAAFGRAQRLRRFVQHACEKLHLAATWNYEIAAMLSQLGCVALSSDLVGAVYAGQRLSAEDQERYDGHAALASRMLSNIPRMEAIAQMIRFQHPVAGEIKADSAEERQEIARGIQLLQVGLTYDECVCRGLTTTEAVRRVRNSIKGVEPAILDALEAVQPSMPMQVRQCGIRELSAGMILQQDLYTDTGLLIAAKGQELSWAWIERLKEYWQNHAIAGRVTVLLPQSSTD